MEIDRNVKNQTQENIELELHTKLFKHHNYSNDYISLDQLHALDYCYEQSKELSRQNIPGIIHKPLSELQSIKNYLKNIAPIVIHLNLDKTMNFLCEDLYYRNIFETKYGGGSNNLEQRNKWEKNLFLENYANSDGFDKVKYGTLNIFNTPKGTENALTYGDSYIKLKNEIKDRCTLTYGDSSVTIKGNITTFHFLYPLIKQYIPIVYNTLLKLSKNESTVLPLPFLSSVYTEVQIHGSIKLDRDIEALYVNSRHKSDSFMIEKLEWFKKNYKCNYIWI